MKRFQVVIEVTTPDTFKFLGKDRKWTVVDVKRELEYTLRETGCVGREGSFRTIQFIGRGTEIT